MINRQKYRKFFKNIEYCCTIFQDLDCVKIDKTKIAFFIGQWEICPSTGKKHLQAYIQLNDIPNNSRELNRWLGLPIKSGHHYTSCSKDSTPLDNIEYCTKMEKNDIEQKDEEALLSYRFGFFETEKKLLIERFNTLYKSLSTSIRSIKNEEALKDEEDKFERKNNIFGKKLKSLKDDIKSGLNFDELTNKHALLFCFHNSAFMKCWHEYKPQPKLNSVINNDNIKPFTNKVNDLALFSEDNREVVICCDLVQEDPNKNAIPLTGVGKSQTAKYIYNNAVDDGKKVQIFDSSKKENLAHALNDDVDLVIFDLTKSARGFTNWDAIECIKNGIIFSGKYNSHAKYLSKIPNIIIFCNDIDNDLNNKISSNRLRFVNIIDKEGNFNETKINDDDDYKKYYKSLYPENLLSKKLDNDDFTD